jgi:hypothetical protein
MAVFKILAEIEGGVSPQANGARIQDFKPFLYALATRFHAAKLLADVMDEAISNIVERSKSQGIVHTDVKTSVPSPSGSSPKGSDATTDEDEAELLNCVAKMVDLRLSTDGSK